MALTPQEEIIARNVIRSSLAGRSTRKVAAPSKSFEEKLQEAKNRGLSRTKEDNGFLEKAGKGVAGFFSGVGKGLLSTVKGAATLGEKVVSAPARALGLVEKEELTAAQELTGDVERALDLAPGQLTTPQGTAEKIGFTMEQIGEFLIPGGASTKVAKIPAITRTGKLAKLGGRVATEVMTVGGQTALQTGELGKDSAIAGGFAGAFPIAGQILKPISKIPENSWAGLLKRTSSVVKKDPDLPAKAAQTGLTAVSKEQLAQKAGKVVQQIEMQMDDLLKKQTGKIKTSSIVDHLNGLKDAYAKIPGESRALKTIDEIGEDVLALGKELTPAQANVLKRDIYQLIQKSYGKGVLENPVKAEAQKQVARALKTEIEKVIPDVKDLNQRQAIYLQIKKALDRQASLGEGRGAVPFVGNIGLTDLLVGIGATAAEGVSTGGAAIVTKKFLTSTPFLTNVAKLGNYFNNLSPTKKILFQKFLEGSTAQTISE